MDSWRSSFRQARHAHRPLTPSTQDNGLPQPVDALPPSPAPSLRTSSEYQMPGLHEMRRSNSSASLFNRRNGEERSSRLNFGSLFRSTRKKGGFDPAFDPGRRGSQSTLQSDKGSDSGSVGSSIFRGAGGSLRSFVGGLSRKFKRSNRNPDSLEDDDPSQQLPLASPARSPFIIGDSPSLDSPPLELVAPVESFPPHGSSQTPRFDVPSHTLQNQSADLHYLVYATPHALITASAPPPISEEIESKPLFEDIASPLSEDAVSNLELRAVPPAAETLDGQQKSLEDPLERSEAIEDRKDTLHAPETVAIIDVPAPASRRYSKKRASMQITRTPGLLSSSEEYRRKRRSFQFVTLPSGSLDRSHNSDFEDDEIMASGQAQFIANPRPPIAPLTTFIRNATTRPTKATAIQQVVQANVASTAAKAGGHAGSAGHLFWVPAHVQAADEGIVGEDFRARLEAARARRTSAPPSAIATSASTATETADVDESLIPPTPTDTVSIEIPPPADAYVDDQPFRKSLSRNKSFKERHIVITPDNIDEVLKEEKLPSPGGPDVSGEISDDASRKSLRLRTVASLRRPTPPPSVPPSPTLRPQLSWASLRQDDSLSRPPTPPAPTDEFSVTSTSALSSGTNGVLNSHRRSSSRVRSLAAASNSNPTTPTSTIAPPLPIPSSVSTIDEALTLLKADSASIKSVHLNEVDDAETRAVVYAAMEAMEATAWVDAALLGTSSEVDVSGLYPGSASEGAAGTRRRKRLAVVGSSEELQVEDDDNKGVPHEHSRNEGPSVEASYASESMNDETPSPYLSLTTASETEAWGSDDDESSVASSLASDDERVVSSPVASSAQPMPFPSTEATLMPARHPLSKSSELSVIPSIAALAPPQFTNLEPTDSLHAAHPSPPSPTSPLALASPTSPDRQGKRVIPARRSSLSAKVKDLAPLNTQLNLPTDSDDQELSAPKSNSGTPVTPDLEVVEDSYDVREEEYSLDNHSPSIGAGQTEKPSTWTWLSGLIPGSGKGRRSQQNNSNSDAFSAPLSSAGQPDSPTAPSTTKALPGSKFGITQRLFGGGSSSGDSASGSNLARSPPRLNPLTENAIGDDDDQEDQLNGFPRFSFQVEKSIYRISHVKLAQERRPLLEQVVISNLMLYILSVHADVTLNRPGQRGRKKKNKKGRKKSKSKANVSITNNDVTRNAGKSDPSKAVPQGQQKFSSAPPSVNTSPPALHPGHAIASSSMSSPTQTHPISTWSAPTETSPPPSSSQIATSGARSGRNLEHFLAVMGDDAVQEAVVAPNPQPVKSYAAAAATAPLAGTTDSGFLRRPLSPNNNGNSAGNTSSSGQGKRRSSGAEKKAQTTLLETELRKGKRGGSNAGSGKFSGRRRSSVTGGTGGGSSNWEGNATAASDSFGGVSMGRSQSYNANLMPMSRTSSGDGGTASSSSGTGSRPQGSSARNTAPHAGRSRSTGGAKATENRVTSAEDTVPLAILQGRGRTLNG